MIVASTTSAPSSTSVGIFRSGQIRACSAPASGSSGASMRSVNGVSFS